MGRKVKIILPKFDVKEVEFCDKNVKINTHITLENYETILEDIKSTILYNNEAADKYGLLHLRYIKDILDLCTNIDTSSLEGEDLSSQLFVDLLCDNIDNYYGVQEWIEKEYNRWMIENCFGVLGNKLPSSSDMEKSMKNIAETIENLPEDKLELISKSIVWNNMPALGKQVAPATHVELMSEA